jgi:hypothetical protein
MQSPFIRLYWEIASETFYIDFRPNEDDIIPEGVDYRDANIIQTGRGYFLTLPTKWFKSIQPTKASLMQLEEKRTVYKVQFYGND